MRFILCITTLLVFSCKNETKEDKVSLPEIVQSTQSKDAGVQSTELEIYDYAELEKYLTTTSDKTYVINFWATWCAPCVKELPYFEQVNKNYADQNVEVILVSLDFPKKYDTSLKPFIKEKNLKAKVVALNDPDSNSWIPKISEDWSGAIPATLIYNKDKRQFYEQSFTYDELENEVKQFLK